MSKAAVAKPLLVVLLVWVAAVSLYGWYEVSGTMALLAVRPSPDLYANDFGFQVLAFILTKGLASVLLLGVALVVVATIRFRKARTVESSASSAQP
jgi:O-antigen ligase